MRSAWQYFVLLAACSSGLSASSLLTCSFDGGSFSSAGCYTSPTFSTVETVDWLTALGTANQGFHSTTADDPSSYWRYTTPNGVGISVTTGPDGTADAILRADNFFRYYDSGTGLWKAYNAFGSPYANYATYMGMFDAAPDGSGPGDHLIYANGDQGDLELQFDQGINGIMFRISTPDGGGVSDVNAIIKAYAVANPTSSDIPIATYAINATNAGGLCAGLDKGSVTAPVPCNLAPFIGIQGRAGDIRSVVISSTDPNAHGGLYISSLFLDETITRDPGNDTSVPEPGTFTLFGGSFAVLAAALRRRAARL